MTWYIRSERAVEATAETTASVKGSGASSTRNIRRVGSATTCTQQSEELVADPMTGKLIRKSLHEATERLREADKTRDWRKRRVF